MDLLEALFEKKREEGGEEEREEEKLENAKENYMRGFFGSRTERLKGREMVRLMHGREEIFVFLFSFLFFLESNSRFGLYIPLWGLLAYLQNQRVRSETVIYLRGKVD